MKIPEGITINYISPAGSTTDITKSVLYSDAYFVMQAAAVAGSFHITVRDPDQSHSFVAGGRIEMYLGSIKMFGGFVTVPTRDFFVAADRTDRPVRTRRWSLDGVDYNYLLDKRVLRNPSDYTHSIPAMAHTSGHPTDVEILAQFANYFDLDFSGSGTIDVSTSVTHADTWDTFWKWPDQGSTMRAVLDAMVIDTTRIGQYAAIYWLAPSQGANGADIHWLALQTTAAPWGFSDMPDGTNFIAWRDGAVSEDGGAVINEVFIWGGSPLGSKGAVVLAHKSNATSISDHGIWQMGESHPGEDLFKSQGEVDARGNALISGSTSGTSPVTGAQGLVNPDRQYTLTWFAHDVPISGGVRQHLIPGMATTFNLWSFSGDDGVTPYSIVVPLRQVRISFPTLSSNNPDGDPLTFVQFTGTFGLQMSDPVWWWQYLRKMRPKRQAAPIVTTDSSSGSYPYGSYFTDSPQESPDSSRVLFSIIPAYISGTMIVYLDGLLQAKGTAWSETDPTAGTFTFTSPPTTGLTIICECRTG